MYALVRSVGFRSFRLRMIVFMLALLLPVFGAIYLVISQNNRLYTIQTIDSYLTSGAGVFDFTLQQETRTLTAILSSLTWDYGFRSAYGSGDKATLLDASFNVLDRSMGSVDLLMVVDLDGRVVVDTGRQGMHKLSGPWSELLESADLEDNGIAEGVMPIDGVPYRLIVLPLFLPHQVAWIIGGYALDQKLLNQVKRNTLSDVSLLGVRDGRGQVIFSTFPQTYWQALGEQFDPSLNAFTVPQQFNLNGEFYGTLSRSLRVDAPGGTELFALIHRSYQENLANEERSQRFLKQWYLIVLAICVTAVLILAKSITRPIDKLAAFVRNIERGDFDVTVDIDTHDELGRLADSVNSMAKSLVEKEKARDLLGKVVSPEIADQLIEKRVNLEGEEKIVTVMYVDIRGFTTFCEGKNPGFVLGVLNRYLRNVVSLIEIYDGVVDKFMGDGVMALFGAPIETSNDVENALNAALSIKEHWQRRPLSGSVKAEDQLVACIGVHTGLVVAGNVGSVNRMNYSVVGDTVNLAARLEGLTRYYGVPCIVSEETVRQARSFLYRELDLVRVLGRRDPVRIYELIGKPGEVSTKALNEIWHFEEFLVKYRNQQWDEAEAVLMRIADNQDYTELHGRYRERISYFRENPPDVGWQGIYTFEHK